MAIEYLDGIRLYRGVSAGLQKVMSRREYLNKINVFPVPDGDTGTNMAHTLATIERNIRDKVTTQIQKVSQMIADSALDGARGNSGAIFAQFFVGLSEGITQKEKISPDEFVVAAKQASDSSYEALMQPREGTMLTVIRVWSQTVERVSKNCNDFKLILAEALEKAKIALAETPKQLAVLAKAGVVDAGAQGFVDFLEGIQSYIDTGEIPLYENVIVLEKDEAQNVELQDEFQYCTECVMEGTDLNRIAIKEAIQDKGGSIVIAGGKNKVKIHIHTNNPKEFFDTCRKFGEVLDEKADDMLKQQKDSHTKHGKIAIVVDSACDLPQNVIDDLGLHVVPVRLNFGDDHYIDKVTMTSEEFWKEFNRNPNHPKTSQPTPGDFRRQYQFLEEHYESVVSLHLPLKLSGTVQSANAVSKEFKKMNLNIFESNNGSVGLGLIAKKVAESANDGKNIEEVLQIAKRAIDETKNYVYLDDLKYVVRGGRLPAKKKKILNILHLSPILSFSADGLKPVGFLIDKKNKRNNFLKRMLKKVSSSNFKIGIAHGNLPNEIDSIAKLFIDKVGKENVVVTDLGPALGAHGGPGAMAIAIQPF